MTPEEGFAIAYHHYSNERFGDAENACRQILNVFPAHTETWMLYALMLQRVGKTAEANQLLHSGMQNRVQTIRLDAYYDGQSRWMPHKRLEALIQPSLNFYDNVIKSFEHFLPWLGKIDFDADSTRPASPHWNNPWLPVLDAVALYCFVSQRRPRTYVEIGSGNSTKFVARAVADHGLSTRIISIDPKPRADIDQLCHEVIRQPLEKCNLRLFDSLGENDIVFADNSHRSFMNSDATVFFCEIMPGLRSGVVVGIHDIFLPFDYPADWDLRYYSEQYLLACWLLAGTHKFETLLPMYYVSEKGSGATLLRSVRDRITIPGWHAGSSFWIRIC